MLTQCKIKWCHQTSQLKITKMTLKIGKHSKSKLTAWEKTTSLRLFKTLTPWTIQSSYNTMFDNVHIMLIIQTPVWAPLTKQMSSWFEQQWRAHPKFGIVLTKQESDHKTNNMLQNIPYKIYHTVDGIHTHICIYPDDVYASNIRMAQSLVVELSRISYMGKFWWGKILANELHV